MADVNVNENEQIDENIEEVSTDEVVKPDKTFTQSDLNRVVQNRLKKVNQEHESEVSGYQEQITTYENIIQQMIDLKSKVTFQIMVKKLLGKLSVTEQLEFLASEDAQVSKKKIPQTPKPSNEVVQKNEKPLFQDENLI